MPSDSVSFKEGNSYRVEIKRPQNGTLKIYFKGYLLCKYSLIDGQINGIGIFYYPFLGNVAVQGQFVDGKLHGLVFLQRENGEIVEVMKYRNGVYVKHVFHWLSHSKKSLRARSMNRSSNPLKNNEEIIR